MREASCPLTYKGVMQSKMQYAFFFLFAQAAVSGGGDAARSRFSKSVFQHLLRFVIDGFLFHVHERFLTGLAVEHLHGEGDHFG